MTHVNIVGLAVSVNSYKGQLVAYIVGVISTDIICSYSGSRSLIYGSNQKNVTNLSNVMNIHPMLKININQINDTFNTIKTYTVLLLQRDVTILNFRCQLHWI